VIDARSVNSALMTVAEVSSPGGQSDIAVFARHRPAVRHGPDGAHPGSSHASGCASPILSGTDDWDLIESLHFEQIPINSD
jgi:hypothetical protein